MSLQDSSTTVSPVLAHTVPFLEGSLRLTTLLPHTNLLAFYWKFVPFHKCQVINGSNKMSTWSITSLPVP